MKTYTIHRGTVRSSFALYHHVMPIYARHERARVALAEAEANGIVVRGERAELKNATARADEARTMHLVPFVPPYVPAKASRVYPALKTCTSPRRAFAWQVKTGRLRHDPTIAAMYPTTGQMLKWTGVKITIDGHEAKGFADDEFRPAAEVMSDTSFASMVGVPFTVR